MTNRFARLLPISFALITTLGAPAFAATYFFTGQCTDCFSGIGSATATLVLEDYTPGDPVLSSNLVSFSYDGTDLLAPFVITPDTLASISGAMPQEPPAFASFAIGLDEPGLFRLFVTSINGEWGIDDDGPDDFGTNGIWTMAVPEPASISLTIIALLALSVVHRPRMR